MTAESEASVPYSIPTNERYFLDADGFCWREVEINGQVLHSMARINPDNSATPGPLLHLTPVTQEHHTLRAYRLALLDAAAIFADTAVAHEGNAFGRRAYAEGARVLRRWASDPGRMIGPLHRLRATAATEASPPPCFCGQPDDRERVHRSHDCEPWSTAASADSTSEATP